MISTSKEDKYTPGNAFENQANDESDPERASDPE